MMAWYCGGVGEKEVGGRGAVKADCRSPTHLCPPRTHLLRKLGARGDAEGGVAAVGRLLHKLDVVEAALWELVIEDAHLAPEVDGIGAIAIAHANNDDGQRQVAGIHERIARLLFPLAQLPRRQGRGPRDLAIADDDEDVVAHALGAAARQHDLAGLVHHGRQGSGASQVHARRPRQAHVALLQAHHLDAGGVRGHEAEHGLIAGAAAAEAVGRDEAIRVVGAQALTQRDHGLLVGGARGVGGDVVQAAAIKGVRAARGVGGGEVDSEDQVGALHTARAEGLLHLGEARVDAVGDWHEGERGWGAGAGTPIGGRVLHGSGRLWSTDVDTEG